jgi:hypothetical protein
MSGVGEYNYLGYLLSVQSQGKGLKIIILPPGGGFSLTEIPWSEGKSEEDFDALMAQAKAAVDTNIQKIAAARAKRS